LLSVFNKSEIVPPKIISFIGLLVVPSLTKCGEDESYDGEGGYQPNLQNEP
jgi:hypothetical protein